MQNKQLNPSSYKDLVKNLGRQWKEMSKENKAQFQVRAEDENSFRNELLKTPLPTPAGKHQTEAQSHAAGRKSFRKFLIRAKPKRALINQDLFERSDTWQSHGLGLADHRSALKLELFDTTQDQSQAATILKNNLHGELPRSVPPETLPDTFHNISCGALHGQCKCNFRSSMRHLAQLRLSEFIVSNSLIVGSCLSLRMLSTNPEFKSPAAYVLLGSMYKKPCLVIMLQLHPTSDPLVFSMLGSYSAPSFTTAAILLDQLTQKLGTHPVGFTVAQHECLTLRTYFSHNQIYLIHVVHV